MDIRESGRVCACRRDVAGRACRRAAVFHAGVFPLFLLVVLLLYVRAYSQFHLDSIVLVPVSAALFVLAGQQLFFLERTSE
jgi:hypothetical protein